MARAILIGLLMAVVAWPSSLCFCHAGHDVAHHEGSDSAPDEDNHDDDCTCCKQRQVLAVTSPHLLDPDDLVATLPDRDVDPIDAMKPIERPNTFPTVKALSLEILCALRI